MLEWGDERGSGVQADHIPSEEIFIFLKSFIELAISNHF